MGTEMEWRSAPERNGLYWFWHEGTSPNDTWCSGTYYEAAEVFETAAGVRRVCLMDGTDAPLSEAHGLWFGPFPMAGNPPESMRATLKGGQA